MRFSLCLATITLISLVGCNTPVQEPDGPTRVIPVKAAFMCNARPWAMANELYNSLACVRQAGAFASLKDKDVCRYQLRWVEEQMNTYVRCYSDAFDLRANEVYAEAATVAGEKPVEIEIPELAEIREAEGVAPARVEAEESAEASNNNLLSDMRKFSLGLPMERKTASAPLKPGAGDAIQLPLPPNCKAGEKKHGCGTELVQFRRQLDDWISKASDVVQSDIERFHEEALSCFNARSKRAEDDSAACSLMSLPQRMP